jgi:hypothetical protein
MKFDTGKVNKNCGSSLGFVWVGLTMTLHEELHFCGYVAKYSSKLSLF